MAKLCVLDYLQLGCRSFLWRSIQHLVLLVKSNSNTRFIPTLLERSLQLILILLRIRFKRLESVTQSSLPFPFQISFDPWLCLFHILPTICLLWVLSLVKELLQLWGFNPMIHSLCCVLILLQNHIHFLTHEMSIVRVFWSTPLDLSVHQSCGPRKDLYWMWSKFLCLCFCVMKFIVPGKTCSFIYPDPIHVLHLAWTPLGLLPCPRMLWVMVSRPGWSDTCGFDIRMSLRFDGFMWCPQSGQGHE